MVATRATKAQLLAELQEMRARLAAIERVRKMAVFPGATTSDEQARIIAILETAPDFISYATPEGQILFINAAGRALAGLQPDEDLSTARIRDFHPPWAAAVIEQIGLPAAIRDGSWRGESALLNAAGQEIPVSQAIIAHRSPGGALQYVSTIIRDISEQKRVEQALRDSEIRFRDIVVASPMGIHLYELRDDGRLVFLDGNPAADAILGVDHAAFGGQTIEEAFPLLVGTEVPTRYRELAAHGGTWHAEQIRYEDQHIRGAFEVHAFQTGPGRMAALFLDITERKRAAAEREALQEQLRQAQKMEAIGRLAGGVAHDFNNVLTAISGYAELLLHALPSADPLRSDAEEILLAAQRATRLTEQLLAFSRRQTSAPVVLEPNALVARSQRMLERIIGEDIQLVFLPAEGAWNVNANPSQLEQILINLAVNARDAMPGGGTLTIETRNADLGGPPASDGQTGGGRFVCLVVSDTGAGIDNDTLEHIFEPFFTTKDPGEGTGLGLATVYGIVQQHGGRITVASRPGTGTTFRILLPAVNAPAMELGAPVVDTPTRGTETILLTEDDATTRRLATKLLRHHGYHVIAAANGAAALELAASCERPVELLLTDMVMPGMSGKKLFAALREIWPQLKVLFMSGYHANVLAHHAAPAAHLPFLAKPFSSAELAAKVRAVLDGDAPR